jgi:hypothetical protein
LGVPGIYTEKGVDGRNVGVEAVACVAEVGAVADMLVAEITSSAKLLVVVVVVVVVVVSDDFVGCIADVDKLNSLKPVEC